MHVKDFLEAVDFTITGGAEFLWSCYGPNTWILDSGDNSAVINRNTGRVYEVLVLDSIAAKLGSPCKPCKWVDPSVIEEYIAESTRRGFDPWQAYDDVSFTLIKEESDVLDELRNTR